MEEKQALHGKNGLGRGEFLKLAGLAAAALGTGYAAGMLCTPRSQKKLALHAFLPEDKALAGELVKAFWHLTGGPGDVLVKANERWARVIHAAAAACPPTAAGFTSVHIACLEQPIPSDFLFSDNQVSVFDPAYHFTAEMAALRQKIRGQAASHSLCMLFTQQSGQISGRSMAVIRDQYGLFDRLPLDRNYQDIPVEGPFGKTHLRIESGHVWVYRASCRHYLCQYAGRLSLPGERAACAPNRLLVEIEMG